MIYDKDMAKGKSNKDLQGNNALSDANVRKHNAMPVGNERKISGSFPKVPNQSRDIQAPGNGEYDRVVDIRNLA